MVDIHDKFWYPEVPGAQFSHSRFTPKGPQLLFSAHNTAKAGSFVTKWTVKEDWALKSSLRKKVDKNTVCSFAMAPQGDMFAIGTSEGDIKVWRSSVHDSQAH